MKNLDWKNSQEKMSSLKYERLLITLATAGSLVFCLLLVRLAVQNSRIETVFLDNVFLDSPVKVSKVRTEVSSYKSDKWVRGFTRNYLSKMFPHPKDVTEETMRADLSWLYAHTGDAGRDRFEGLFNKVKQYIPLFQKAHRIFYAENSDAFTIRQSETDKNLLLVKVPGALFTVTDEGRSIKDDVYLKLIIKRVTINGQPSLLGDFNVYGLQVEDGMFEVPTETGTKNVKLFTTGIFD